MSLKLTCDQAPLYTKKGLFYGKAGSLSISGIFSGTVQVVDKWFTYFQELECYLIARAQGLKSVLEW